MIMELWCLDIVFDHTESKMFEFLDNRFSQRNLRNCCRIWPRRARPAAPLTRNLGVAGLGRVEPHADRRRHQHAPGLKLLCLASASCAPACRRQIDVVARWFYHLRNWMFRES